MLLLHGNTKLSTVSWGRIQSSEGPRGRIQSSEGPRVLRAVRTSGLAARMPTSSLEFLSMQTLQAAPRRYKRSDLD